MTSIPTDLVDSAFVVQYDNRFVNVKKSTAGGTSTKTVANNVATITVSATGTTASGTGGYVTLTVTVNSFADDYYNTYATYPGSNNIKTLVTVSGRSSGAMVIQEFNIKKNSSS